MSAPTPPRIAAIVPMRHTNERVPGENRRLLGGRPLYLHTLESLAACSAIAEMVIDTDSEEIRAGAVEQFPDLTVIDPPQRLRASTVTLNDVLLHTVTQVEVDYYLQTHCSTPLLRPETISSAIDTFLAHRATDDSLFSVTRFQKCLWDEQGQPLNHDPQHLIRSQDLRPIYVDTSSIYLFSGDTLRSRRRRIGAVPYLFEVDSGEAWEIDEEFDWTMVELLYQHRIQQT